MKPGYGSKIIIAVILYFSSSLLTILLQGGIFMGFGCGFGHNNAGVIIVIIILLLFFCCDDGCSSC